MRYESDVRGHAPVSEGEEYNVHIEGKGREGDGIARVNNFVVFVPGTEIGDDVRIRIRKVARSVAFAETI